MTEPTAVSPEEAWRETYAYTLGVQAYLFGYPYINMPAYRYASVAGPYKNVYREKLQPEELRILTNDWSYAARFKTGIDDRSRP